MKENEESKQEEEEKWEDTARESTEFDEDEVILPEEPEEEEPAEKPDGESVAEEPSDKEPEASDREPKASGKDPKASDKEPETSAKESKSSDDDGAGKSGPFRKKEKKDPKDEKIEELTDRVRRQMAEFDNFRKRTEKEKSQMFETGAKSVIEKILPVIDNFERGLDSIPEEEKDGAFAEGMQKVYRQMMQTLEEMDVRPIEAEGQEFNPELHNAVLHVDDEELGENIVVEELQKGYMYRDSVVRHSMVKVAN